MYGDLVYAAPGLKADDVGKYFKDSTFGVRPDDVESTISPRSDVTIVRDKGFGVPHVYGSTRGGTMFGAGYVAAQDRLFFIDVLRHAGPGRAVELRRRREGQPRDGRRAVVAGALHEADFQHQYDLGEQVYGAKGAALKQDAADYVAGINQYISEARLDPSKMPGEYAAIGRPQGPDDWKVTDLFATASLVGGIFGKGGGQELAQVELLRAFTKKFGQKKGRQLWEQFAAFEDKDAPTTVTTGKRFPYQAKPQGQAGRGRRGAARQGLVQGAGHGAEPEGRRLRARGHHGRRHERRGGHPRRPGRVPDRDVQRAAALGQEVGVGQADRRHRARRWATSPRRS